MQSVTSLRCPNGCGAVVNQNKNGMKVRICEECNYYWLANPVLDALNQSRASLTQKQPYPFTPNEISTLDQLQAAWAQNHDD